MNLDIRLPQITGQTEREQLIQIKSYLYQLVPQLQWALEDINKRQEAFTSSDPQRGIAQSLVGSGTSNASPQDTFASIKALIIKSADIVNAYYEEISKRLEGEYEAISTFGSFKQRTEAIIKESSEKIELSFNNIQQINTDFNGRFGTIDGDLDALGKDITGAKDQFNESLETIQENIGEIGSYVKDVKATIKPGLLYYDDKGTPIYGIEIGQIVEKDGVEVFNKCARFTSDRLSFFDKKDVEVAYICDYMLHITDAEITGKLKLGGYLVDTSSGIAFKWSGRG
jgi:hypothetical protein